MPTYSYECAQCGHVFDVFHGMLEQPQIQCEQCEAACQRLMGTGAGIIFKGSGFYETDYKKKSGGEARSGANGADKTEQKDTAKSDGGASGNGNGGAKSGGNGKSDKAATSSKSAAEGSGA